jgi:hypothetical protein
LEGNHAFFKWDVPKVKSGRYKKQIPKMKEKTPVTREVAVKVI